jgi:hypothetical protein
MPMKKLRFFYPDPPGRRYVLVDGVKIYVSSSLYMKNEDGTEHIRNPQVHYEDVEMVGGEGQ